MPLAPPTPPAERWVPHSLTAELDIERSPLRRHLQGRFPNRAWLLAEYREAAGPMLVDTSGANLGTIGTAFEVLTDFVLDPHHVPDLAVRAFAKRGGADTVKAVITWAQLHAGTGPDANLEVLARSAWAIALCIEVFRIGVIPNTALAQLRDAKAFTPANLLELASDDAAAELQALHEVALQHLHPHLSEPTPHRSLHLGATFAASTLCAADADIVCEGLLLELKTRLGSWRAGTADRYTHLSLIDIYQLLGYVLFDTDNTYGIDRVGWYAARYGHLATWPLQQFLTGLAGHDVDLAEERAMVSKLLTAG